MKFKTHKLIPGNGVNMPVIAEAQVTGFGRTFVPASDGGGSLSAVISSALYQLLTRSRNQQAARVLDTSSPQVKGMALAINSRRLR